MRKLKHMILLPVMAALSMTAQAGPTFTYGLFRDIVSNDGADIVFISPLSASFALSMTANGADGATLQEMLSTLGFEASVKELNEYNRSVMDLFASDPEGVRLNAANSIWVSEDFPLKGKFSRTVTKNYDAMVTNLDFSDPASPSIINNWCSENTAGRIDKMIETIDPTTRMYLLNALYFKGEWSMPFPPESSRNDVFHGNNNDAEVKFMRNTADLLHYVGPEGSVVELPYGKGSFVMDIFLPADGVSAEEFVSGFDGEALDTFTTSMRSGRVRVIMPSFKAEYETSLNAVLQRLGMQTAFTPSADFSRISKEPLMISEVKQKTFVEVNEKGSEAAAVTSVAVMRASFEPDPVEFKVDRPFVFLIRERESGTVLFMGLVRNL